MKGAGTTKGRVLTPAILRLVLVASLVLITILSCAVFYIAYQQLDKIAGEVGAKVADANSSQNMLQELRRLEQDLEKNKEIVDKTSRIAADSQNYTYQDQIVSDLTAYAERSGMTISNITFNSAGSAGAAPSAQPPATAETPTGAPSPSGLRTSAITVTLKSPADYKGLLNFLHYIEQNLTKLKIANISLTKGESETVNTDVLNLEVYLR